MGKEALLTKLEQACDKTEKLIENMAYPIVPEEYKEIVLSQVGMLRAQKQVKDEYNKENCPVDEKLTSLDKKVGGIVATLLGFRQVAIESDFRRVIGSPTFHPTLHQHAKKPPVPAFHGATSDQRLHEVIKNGASIKKKSN